MFTDAHRLVLLQLHCQRDGAGAANDPLEALQGERLDPLHDRLLWASLAAHPRPGTAKGRTRNVNPCPGGAHTAPPARQAG